MKRCRQAGGLADKQVQELTYEACKTHGSKVVGVDVAQSCVEVPSALNCAVIAQLLFMHA